MQCRACPSPRPRPGPPTGRGMAIQELHIGVRLTDVWGLKASTDLYAAVDDTQTIAQLITESQLALTVMDPITDAQITAGEIRLTVPVTGLTGLKTAPTGNQKVDMVGLFGYAVSGTKKHYAVPVPAISSATTVLVGDRIVTGTGTPANTFAKHLLSAGTAIKTFDNNTNQALVAGAYALIGDRSRRKQLGSSSREPLTII